MFHIALICPPTKGHLNPTLSIASRLVDFGYKVSFIGWPDVEKIVLAYDVNFICYGQEERPEGYIKSSISAAQKLVGIDSVKYTFKQLEKHLSVSFEQLPKILISNNIDLLIVDHACVEISTICEHLELPFITLCNALVSQIDLRFTASHRIGGYSNYIGDKISNFFSYIEYSNASRSLVTNLNRQRKSWKLSPIRKPSDLYSKRAIISQQTHDLEYPHNEFSSQIYYIGPFISESQKCTNADIEFANDYPTIYASLGTINTGIHKIYQIITNACKKLEVNLVLSLGRPLEKRDDELQGERIKILPFVNQISFLSQCDLCITHAGMNTTMHCIYNGIPMIAIPLGNEQPGIASRISWNKAGIALDHKKIDENILMNAIINIISDKSYYERMKTYQLNCLEAGGINKATQIIKREIEKIEISVPG